MAASTGLPRVMRVGPIGPSPVSLSRLPDPAASALRSKPAQKLPPAPVRTATDTLSSASKRRKQSASASAVSESTAFRACGRSMVTVTTAPSIWYETVLERASLAVIFHERVTVLGRRCVGLLDDSRTHPADQVEDRARLIIRARRARATEGLQADDRPGRLVVDVEVPSRVHQHL